MKRNTCLTLFPSQPALQTNMSCFELKAAPFDWTRWPPSFDTVWRIIISLLTCIGFIKNSKCAVQSIYRGSFKTWKTFRSLQLLQLPDYIGWGNLPKRCLHIGHMCYATHHWLTFRVLYLSTSTRSLYISLRSSRCTPLVFASSSTG